MYYTGIFLEETMDLMVKKFRPTKALSQCIKKTVFIKLWVSEKFTCLPDIIID